MSKLYWVYILKCADHSLYTGIATDVARRLDEHNQSDKGAKYTRARRPVELVYIEPLENRSLASKREASIKKLSRTAKQRLILDCRHESEHQATSCKVALYDYTI